MAKNRFPLKETALLFGALLLLSCAAPQGTEKGESSLTILLPGGSANGGSAERSVLSNDLIATLRYQITLTGPGGTLDRTAEGGSITLFLQAGEWAVTAQAYDGGALVGTGGERAVIVSGRPASLVIKMSVDPGYAAGLRDIYIHNETELRRVGTDFAIDGSKTFHLENDITLIQPWTPIGDDGNRFKAVFDGGGHTITVAAFSAGALAAQYMGFFGYAEGGEIKNLHIKYALGGRVNNTNTDYFVYAGGIAGRAEGTGISNTRVSGSFGVSSSAISDFYTGGIAGAYFNGVIEQCHVAGAEWGGGSTATIIAGGIAGELGSTGGIPAIKSSSFTGTVVVQGSTGSAYGGGIVGRSYGGTITACYAAGTIDVSSESAAAYAGGMVGSFGYFPVSDCYAYVNVQSSGSTESYAGGIAGYASEIAGCYAAGAVKAEGSGAVVYAGGIAGQVTNSGGLTNCVVLLNALDGGASADVHTLFGGYAIWFAANSGNSIWNAIAITRGGTIYTYTDDDSFSGISLDPNKDMAVFGPAEDYTNPIFVSGSYPGWDFAAGTGDWQFVPGYDLPVLSWQASPPDLSHVPDNFVFIWP